MSDHTEKRILVVEDDASVREFLDAGLAERGFKVDCCADGKAGWAKAQKGKGRYAVCVLDIMLPGLDGHELVRRMRAGNDVTPVLFLTAKDSVQDRVSGLDAGGDDYLVKPFALEELVARVNALIRRSSLEGTLTITRGDLVVDRLERKVTYRGQRVELTQREYQLLDYFMRNPGVVLSRDQISRDVWGLTYTGESNFVDVYVRHLRQKVWEDDESQVTTVRGHGYMFGGE